MQISVTDAKAQLTELVRRAEAGDAIVLTRYDQPVVRFVPVAPRPDRRGLDAVIKAIRASAAAKITPGPCGARSQDFLYDEDGLPR